MNKAILYLERKLAANLFRLLRKSLRFEVIDRDPNDGNCIYMFWHRNLLLCTLQRMGDPVAVIISASKDGELIAGPVSELGFIPVRGSSSRQGHRALMEMIRYSKTCQLAITPDGPKGPPKTIKPGVFQIALLGKIPIIPVVADADREWVFNSWDRFRLPKPFAKVKLIYGRAFHVLDKDSIPALETEIKAYMQELEARL